MNSAMLLFVEHGYEEVTLKQVAEHADIHVQTLYKHFDSKLSLATSFFDWWGDLALGSVVEEQADESFYLQVKHKFISALGAIMANDFALDIFQMIHRNEELLAHTQHRLRLLEDQLGERFVSNSDLDEFDSRLLAASIVAAYRDAHFSWIRSGGKVNSVDRMAAFWQKIESQFSEKLKL